MSQLKLPSIYQYKTHLNHASKSLVVTLSMTPNKFDLPSPLNQTTSNIQISDGCNSLFLYKVGLACAGLADYIKKYQFETVVLYGSKRSALAALLWSSILDRILSGVNSQCICINPELDVEQQIYHDVLTKTQISNSSFLVHLKEFLSPERFLVSNNLNPKGAIYLAHNNSIPKSFKRFADLTIFQTKHHVDDINYFLKTAISASQNGYLTVFKQKDVQHKYCDQNIALEQVNQNYPTVIAGMKSITEHGDLSKLFLGNHVDMEHDNFENHAVYIIETFNQYINAINCQSINEKYRNITLIFQYTRINLTMSLMVMEHYLKNNLKNTSNIQLKFYEIYSSNRVNYLDFFNFQNKYHRLIENTKINNLIVTSLEYRTAILCHTARACGVNKIMLIEEGLGTYDQINRYHLNQKFKHFVCQKVHYRDYVQEALIANLGNKVMKNSIKGFFDFNEAYIAAPFMFGNNAKLYSPVQSYIDQNAELIPMIVEALKENNPDSKPIHIYADQTFGLPIEDYYDSIIEILDNIIPKDELIIFQLHPKSFNDKPFVEQLIANKSNRFLFIDFDKPVRIELIVYAIKPKSFYSLTSSSLFYVQLLMPEIETVTFATKLLVRLKEKGYADTPAYKMIRQHSQELEYMQLSVKNYQSCQNKTKEGL